MSQIELKEAFCCCFLLLYKTGLYTFLVRFDAILSFCQNL